MIWAVAAGVIVLVLIAIWVGTKVKHPDQASGHGHEPADTTSDRYYRGADRPAGPDAEDPIGGTGSSAPPPP